MKLRQWILKSRKVIFKKKKKSISLYKKKITEKKKKKKSNKKKGEETITLSKYNKKTGKHFSITIPKNNKERTYDTSESDDTDATDEGISSYRKGGYHPVNIGERYNRRYLIISKLGWGQFSTVWLVWDEDKEKHAAMKIVKSAKHYTEAALDEIKILETLTNGNQDGTKACVQLLDHFWHNGPHGKRKKKKKKKNLLISPFF